MTLTTNKRAEDVGTASVSVKGSQYPKNDSANSTAGKDAGNIFVANDSLTCQK